MGGTGSPGKKVDNVNFLNSFGIRDFLSFKNYGLL